MNMADTIKPKIKGKVNGGEMRDNNTKLFPLSESCRRKMKEDGGRLIGHLRLGGKSSVGDDGVRTRIRTRFKEERRGEERRGEEKREKKKKESQRKREVMGYTILKNMYLCIFIYAL